MYSCIKPNPAYRSLNAFLQERPGFSYFPNQFIQRTTSLKLISVLLFLFSANIIFSQVPNIEWQKSLGGTLSEIAYSIQQTTDGGYIIAGIAGSNDGDVSGNHSAGTYADYWIVKMDVLGNIQWQKCLGGSGLDVAHFIQQTTDGGYIIAGYSNSHDGDVSGNHSIYDWEDSWIIKLDASGNIQWKKCLGGSNQDEANSIQQTTDGGYIVAGWTISNDAEVSGNHGRQDYWVVKLDASGNIQWQKCLGGSLDDVAWAVRQTSDGGYIVAGSSGSNDGNVSGSHGSHDFWIVKLDAAGNIQWQKLTGGSDNDEAYSIQQTTDGGYIVAGRTDSDDGDVSGFHGTGYSDCWIMKLNAVGNVQWKKCLGGSYSDWASAVQQTTDGGYIVSGRTSSNDGDVSGQHNSNGPADSWIVKLDVSGNIQGQKCLGGTNNDEHYAVQQTIDGGYVLAGRSSSNDGDVSGHHGTGGESDFWIVKLGGCAASVPPGMINGNASPCQGSSVTYTIAAVAGIINYTWSVPAGWTIVSGQGTTSISVTVGSNAGNISVIGNSSCSSSQPRTLAVTVGLVIPQITISSVAGTTICAGTSVTFNANAVNGGATPFYQWKINGVNVGANTSTYNSNTFANGDIITCELTNNDGCANPATVVSPGITLAVIPFVSPVLNITTTATTICEGAVITCTATILNAGISPTYQWRLNGVNGGTNSPVYTLGNIPGTYLVDCIVTPGGNSCATGNAVSNSIPVTVNPLPVITVHPADTIVTPYTQVQLTALVNGNIQSFTWSPASELVNSSILSPVTISLAKTTGYQLSVVSQQGCPANAKVTIRVFKKLFMPNAFTPNDDGLNDVFRIPADVFFTLKNFSIYNRWGEKIFFTTDITKGWDGRIKGVKQPTGIYVYSLNGSDDKGAVFLKGSFMLIR